MKKHAFACFFMLFGNVSAGSVNDVIAASKVPAVALFNCIPLFSGSVEIDAREIFAVLECTASNDRNRFVVIG